MAVTVADAGHWLGGIDTQAEGVTANLTRLIETAGAIVERYAPGAPDAVKDHAVLRLVGFLWHNRAGAMEGRGRRPNALSDSGAKQILAQWRVPSHATAKAG